MKKRSIMLTAVQRNVASLEVEIDKQDVTDILQAAGTVDVIIGDPPYNPTATWPGKTDCVHAHLRELLHINPEIKILYVGSKNDINKVTGAICRAYNAIGIEPIIIDETRDNA